LQEVVVEEVVLDFLEVVSVVSLVVDTIPLDAMALLHSDFPLEIVIVLFSSNPGSRFCFVDPGRSKRLKLAPDLSQLPAETPLMSAH
jgi:hypothetical protein